MDFVTNECTVPDCGKPARVKKLGLCGTHHHRWLKYRDVNRVAFIKGNDGARFWSYVEKRGEDECWPWTGPSHHPPKSPDHKYGRIKINGLYVTATRYMYAVICGRDLSDDVDVCHTCDNTICVNPAHLFAGTHSENMLDCVAKGRWNSPRGEKVHTAKLTEDDVRDLRERHASGVSMYQLAKHFGVSAPTVKDAVTRETWKHVA